MPRRAVLAVLRDARRRLAARRRMHRETWAWTLLLAWMLSPLQTFLSGLDPELPAVVQEGGSACRDLRYLAGLVCLAILCARWEAAWRLARAAWPVFAFVAYAGASLVWSHDLPASLAGVREAAPTLLSAWAAAVVLRPVRLLLVVQRVLALAVIASVAAVPLLPRYAVAGVGDLMGASAPGDWRGVFEHKNTLGHVAALAFASLAGPAARRLQPVTFRRIALAAAAACLACAHSMAGVAMALGLTALELTPPLRRRLRGAAIGFGVAGLVLSSCQAGPLGRAGLAALGRDETLSGRVGLWRVARELAAEQPLIGQGLDYSVSPAVADRLMSGFGVNHVHSAVFDLDLNLGAVGVALAAAALLSAGRPAPGGLVRRSLLVLLAGWLASGLVEDMGVRASGPMAQVGLLVLFGLHALRSGRRSFRRPVFGFQPAWRAPLRPPRLRGPP